jgi:hypothetical protein
MSTGLPALLAPGYCLSNASKTTDWSQLTIWDLHDRFCLEGDGGEADNLSASGNRLGLGIRVPYDGVKAIGAYLPAELPDITACLVDE